ncbi:MAG TPA: helix-turn-helix domain-containing protein [Syntrophorhabdales bacterium]|nr:helix-turn-helix domain-containing protein [Syntrophorhabdales bacterium]
MPKDRGITPRWLDLRRASAYCSMHRQTLMRHVHAGEIYATRIDGKWYVDRDSIDSFMMSSMVLIARKARKR